MSGRPRRQQPERAEQRAILDLLQLVKAEAWVLGTTRKRGDWPGTRQTPGAPDIIAIVPETQTWWPMLVMIEVKAPGGRLSSAQQRFRAACDCTGVEHLVGGVDVVLTWLRDRGHLV